MAERIPYPSKSSSKIYHLLIADDGTMSCDCPAWINQKPGQPRNCPHMREETKKRGLRDVDAGVYTITDVVAEIRPSKATDIVMAATREGYFAPMLAESLENRLFKDFSPDDWWMEEKYDGHRVVFAVKDGVVTAWSRPGPGQKLGLLRDDIPEHILCILRAFPNGSYDSELRVPGGRSSDVTRADKRHLLQLVLFDITESNGRDLKGLDAIERRDILDRLGNTLIDHKVMPVRVSETMPLDYALLQALWARGGEGVILKRKLSIYRPGHRSLDWIKFKKLIPHVLTIIGFEAGESGPFSTVVLEDTSVPVIGKVKTQNNYWLGEFAKNSQKYIGRQLQIEHQGLFQGPKGWKFRHAMWDRMIEKGKGKKK